MDVIRAAAKNDLPAIYDVWYADEVAGLPTPPPRESEYLTWGHVLETGELLVCEREGRIIAYAGLVTRGNISFLTDLFVRAEVQSKGIGRVLLERILPCDGKILCTESSRDSRAQSLYLRLGMRPIAPTYILRVKTEAMGELPDADVQVIETRAGDADLLRWDTELSGRERLQDHAYWVNKSRGVPVWFERAGERIGCGYIRFLSDESLFYPQAITLGPICARCEKDARACVGAAARWAKPRASHIRLVIPGPHAALKALLDAHFQIVYVETFLCSAPPFVDLGNYLPSGSVLF